MSAEMHPPEALHEPPPPTSPPPPARLPLAHTLLPLGPASTSSSRPHPAPSPTPAPPQPEAQPATPAPTPTPTPSHTLTGTNTDPHRRPSTDPAAESSADAGAKVVPLVHANGGELFFRTYRSETEDLGDLMRLVEQELSEPYNVYTFRYFLIDWPHLTFLVFPDPHTTTPIATIICKQDSHRGKTNRGYIAMLSVERAWRRRGIASKLVELVIEEMARQGANEVVLETEYDNEMSLALYDKLGFLREKRLHSFYSNGKDAFRLILPLASDPTLPPETDEEAVRGRWLVGSSGPDDLASIPESEGEKDRGEKEGEDDVGGLTQYFTYI